MAEFIYQMIKARKAFGDRVILDDVTLSFLPGAKIGVVGPNGMGKSTLLKIMAGLDTVSNGEASLTPGYTVGILQQEPPLDDTKTVGENIKMAFGEIAEKVARFNQIGEEMANPDADFDALMDEMGKLQNDIDAANGWDLDSQLEQAMDALQCPDPDTPVTVCSGGERRRVALCKLLLEAPDLLLLDEPTNHLDAESILWLEQFLHQYKGAVIAVTHDRYFMDNVAEWICEVDRGQLYPYKGNYTTYLETKAKRMEIQGAKDAKLAKRLKSELDWVRSSPKARQAKNKARLERYDQMEQEARNNKKLDFSEIQIPAGPRLGSTVLEAEHIHKAFGDRVLIDDLSFTANDDNFAALKAILEGSVGGRARNIAVYATSNRRHLIKETLTDRTGDDIHEADTRQELMSLSARFGLTVTFQRPEKARFETILEELAKQHNIQMPTEQLLLKAEAFALRAGGRSPRVAKQFIEQCEAGVQK